LIDDRFLAAHRVDGDDGVRQGDAIQKLGYCRDLIGFLVGGHLAQGFAVDGDEASLTRRGIRRQRLGDPVLKALLKGVGLEGNKQATHAIAGGNAVGQFEVLREPNFPKCGPAVSGRGPFAPADDGREANDRNIDEPMFEIAGVPRVGQRSKCVAIEPTSTNLAIGEILAGKTPKIPSRVNERKIA